MSRVLASLLVVALAAACGGPREPDLAVHGLSVVVDSRAPFTRSADFPPRLESTLAIALDYWGGRWEDLEGLTLTLTDAPSVPCGGAAALGCSAGGAIRVVTADPGAGTFACVEQSVLVHEVGHAVLGDPLHTDPRWMGFDGVAEALAGRVGYGPEGPVDCTLHPAVWRHPLDRP